MFFFSMSLMMSSIWIKIFSIICNKKKKNKKEVNTSAENQLERMMGIEPTYPAWAAGVLPLNYTRMFFYYSNLSAIYWQ